MVRALLEPLAKTPAAFAPAVLIEPSLINVLPLPNTDSPDELFPVVTRFPRLIRIFRVELVELKLSIAEESTPLVVIVAPLSLVSVLPLPLVNRPYDCCPVVVIVPRLVSVLDVPREEIPSKESPTTLTAPKLVAWLWSKIRIALLLVILRLPEGVTVTATLVAPGWAATGRVPGVAHVTDWPVPGFWVSQSASADAAPNSQKLAVNSAVLGVCQKKTLRVDFQVV